MLPMDLAILQRRAVELGGCNISWWIEHLKGYLMVEEAVEQGAEAGGGVDVEEEGVTPGRFCMGCSEKKLRNRDGWECEIWTTGIRICVRDDVFSSLQLGTSFVSFRKLISLSIRGGLKQVHWVVSPSEKSKCSCPASCCGRVPLKICFQRNNL
jgi:hypothetical protein